MHGVDYRKMKQRGQKQKEPKKRRVEENIEAKTEGKERLKMMPKRAIKTYSNSLIS